MTIGRLSSPIAELRPHYDVVVVGSGYGGGVAAARLASPKRSVCVLERGRELRPGDYPATLTEALRNVQIDFPHGRRLSPSALYDLRLNGDLKVLVGCGLGGTSLINANVVLPPDAAVFRDKAWPREIRADAASGRLETYFELAASVLKPEAYPCAQLPRKYLTFKRIVEGLQKPPREERDAIYPPLAPVAVMFPRDDEDAGFRLNDFDVMQHPCTGCGDCVSGCNFAAKNTVLMNYLPMARANGAAIFTEVKVIAVQRRRRSDGDERGWLVHCELVGAGRGRFDASTLTIAADTVILAAGALGSTEILLRSRDKRGLSVSGCLGTRFSGNGDVLAVAHNGREIVNAVGAGRRSFHGTAPPGPCISGSVPLRLGDEPILLQEGVIPGALSPILMVGFLLARLTQGHDRGAKRQRSLWRLIEAVRGGTAATQTLLAMVSDTTFGRLELVGDRIKVVWNGAGRGTVYDDLAGHLQRACAEVDAAFVPSPFGAITVHPLGGCPMADDAAEGVVNHIGAVFSGTRDQVHPGLYVCDASTIPRALGANPLFTISALAERSAESMKPHV